jgi:hypothetical protein
MNPSLEDLELTPNLSRLPGEVVDLIHHGSLDGHAGCQEAAVAVCTAMSQVGFGVDAIWMIMTNPANGISEVFFETDGEQAEVYLERIISEAYEAVAQTECDDQQRRYRPYPEEVGRSSQLAKRSDSKASNKKHIG